MQPIEIIVASGVLEGAPFGLVDVGASGGIDPRWRVFGASLSALAFDPSITGCERLNQAEADQPGDVRYFAQIVGGRRPPRPREAFNSYPFDRLHATAVLREQSLALDDYFNELKPTKFVEDYQILRPSGKAPAPPDLSQRLRPRNAEWPAAPATLDAILREQNFDADFIKIDTDGTDFAVLCGAETALANCPVTAVLIEANFAGDLSPAANTFTNIDTFLRTHGFSLFDLSGPWRYSRQDLPAPFLHPFPSQSVAGQVLWSDALYLRDLAIPPYHDLFDIKIDVAKVCKLVAIAYSFDLPDFAVELVNRYRNAIAERLDAASLIEALSAPKP